MVVPEPSSLWSNGEVIVNRVPLLVGQSRGADLPRGGIAEMSVALVTSFVVLFELREIDDRLFATESLD